MTFVVSVAVTIEQGDTTYVSVCHGESVLPAALSTTEEVEQRDLDLVDLVRVTLARITSEVADTADSQVVQLRGLLEGMA